VREKMTRSSAMNGSLPQEVGFEKVVAWANLLNAYRKATAGKRGKKTVAEFESQSADKLLAIQAALREGSWSPGEYVHFKIHEPKRRRISAAPFADRVVHHALCNVIEPVFERRFIADSYANRAGKGTHRAVNRLQSFARRYQYVLRLDVVKHFPSIDHAILLDILWPAISDPRILDLAAKIVASGDRVLEQEYEMIWFPGDDLFAVCRPRGLPIGNLTSQFWSNCYLNPLDQFIKRELRCRAYLRYVDDMALFSNSKQELWDARNAIVERLQSLRLTVHSGSAQVQRVTTGVPWLGFIVFPSHRLLKGRKVVEASRRLGQRFDAWRAGAISFAEFDASVQGWINHVRYADSWGLREHVLDRLAWPAPGLKSIPGFDERTKLSNGYGVGRYMKRDEFKLSVIFDLNRSARDGPPKNIGHAVFHANAGPRVADLRQAAANLQTPEIARLLHFDLPKKPFRFRR
jgi:RNA-directed DNA polymerase